LVSHNGFNPHQKDQGRKGPCFFQRLIALKCLKCQKILKISNPPLGSYLANEPNLWLIRETFLYDFYNIKKLQKSKDDSILGHSACEAST
jgi:hypothetical protein